MSLPFFYINAVHEDAKFLELDEENSRHIAQVLRMHAGDRIALTNGRGLLLNCELIDNHKKKCRVRIWERTYRERASNRVVRIAISLLNHAGRFEWFLEKATELAVSEVWPLICKRTGKAHLRKDRMEQILVSALIQSQQVWLPEMKDPMDFQQAIKMTDDFQCQKFIAHCLEDSKIFLGDIIDRSINSTIILIGPEGDFTMEEITQAIAKDFVPVSLGPNRLRSETAGLVSSVLLTAG